MAASELPTSDMLGQLPDLLWAVVPFGPDGADELSQATFPILLASLNFATATSSTPLAANGSFGARRHARLAR